MSAFWLTAYVLIWPVIVAAVLLFIAQAFFREWREARLRGQDDNLNVRPRAASSAAMRPDLDRP